MGSPELQGWLQQLRALPEAKEVGCDGTEGDECWLAYFDDAYSPEDALAKDLSYD